MQIAIAGKKSETKNYTAYVEKCGFTPLVTLNTGDIAHCQGLILPGGGDITPAFFGEKNHGSKNIDTELDILQLQSFDYCLRNRIPVLGICKGIQLINVGLGGSISIFPLPKGTAACPETSTTIQQSRRIPSCIHCTVPTCLSTVPTIRH